MSPLRTTYTYAVLEVSAEAYAEIKAKLEEAGYQHAFHENGDEHGTVIDMRGIALAIEPAPVPVDLFVRREVTIEALVVSARLANSRATVAAQAHRNATAELAAAQRADNEARAAVLAYVYPFNPNTL